MVHIVCNHGRFHVRGWNWLYLLRVKETRLRTKSSDAQNRSCGIRTLDILQIYTLSVAPCFRAHSHRYPSVLDIFIPR